ncbi:ExbD/TolR family protein [Zavarzinia sp.]|uniref:ExbD/TolR family protein n=1 Tax=Zavarzinia sp. TaxID=2027920 RepID=UPI00356A3AA8
MAGPLLPGPGGSDDGSLYRPVAEINVTPFVDVMLVLLIIFMVAAPLMMTGVPLHLPKSAAAKLQPQKQPLIVSLTTAGEVFVDKEQVSDADLLARLKPLALAEPERVVYVRGDRTLDYGRVMEVMGLLSSAGFTRLSMIAEGAAARP